MSHLEAFKKLRELAVLGYVPIPINGICSNIYSLLGEPDGDFTELYALFDGWPDHCGNRCYPIPFKHTPECDEECFCKLWIGDELTKRLSLIDYCISNLENPTAAVRRVFYQEGFVI